jgi:release factor glutamine methyltransferase
MSSAETWSIGRLLKWTADYLRGHGSESPRLDAEVLLAETLGCQRIDLYTRFDETPGDEVRAAFRALVRRRAEGAPVAYLVGRREFYSLSFRVTPDVLIPRPETELLVVAVLDLAKKLPANLTIADVGTGSGIIAVCLAKHLPNCRVTAIDLSSAALTVAAGNAKDHGVADRIDLVESDLFANVPADRRFEVIVSNPPYVAQAEMERLAADVKNFEPNGALLAGPRGTEVIASLIPQAAERLLPGGHLLMEVSPTIHDAVRNLLETDGRFEAATTIKDLARLPRVVQARKE